MILTGLDQDRKHAAKGSIGKTWPAGTLYVVLLLGDPGSQALCVASA